MADLPPPEPRDDTAWFAALSQMLMSDHDEAATLQRICRAAPEVVGPAEFCGITVRRRRGRLETLAHTDDLALRCDELQYELGEGPCMDSALEDEPFLVVCTAEDERWPRWGPRVAELGVHALLSVQLSAPGVDPGKDPLGAINLYARRIGAFDDDDLRRALVFGTHAANALATARRITTLGEAVEGRHQIGLAQGVLMQRYGLSVDQAFEALQRYSSNSNVKVRDLAASVVVEGGLPEAYDQVAESVPETS